jgi:hypothetical protein
METVIARTPAELRRFERKLTKVVLANVQQTIHQALSEIEPSKTNIVPAIGPAANPRVSNGVREPGPTGKCRAAWDAFSARAEKSDLVLKDVKELAVQRGWNTRNSIIEFYRWRRFHGLGT